MKKVILSLLFLLICISSVFSQLDVQLSQYMFHNSSFNPAAIAEGNMIHLTGQHRIQWVGIPNGGQTTFFTINGPIKSGLDTHGVGIRFLNDQAGLFTYRSAHLQYAFKKKLDVGILSFGADIGFSSIGLKGDSIKQSDVPSWASNFFNYSGDNAIPKTSVMGTGLDLNIGVYYSTTKGYAGISYSHLNSPTISWDDKTEIKLKGTLYLTGGYNWILPNPKFIVKPSALIKTNFNIAQVDASGLLEYNNKYWGGLSYRFQDAIVILAGINVTDGLSIGYSYDWTTSKLNQVSSGSHEILVHYCFEYVSNKRNNKYKSIRIL